MTEKEAFLAQASSDHKIFRLLLRSARAEVPACHPLHYLQMSTEKLAKAAMLALDQPIHGLTHVAFSQIPNVLARNDIARLLGWQNSKAFRQFLKKSAPMFRQFDELNPSVGTQGSSSAARHQPNVEYPWQARDAAGNVVWHAPINQEWLLIEQLQFGRGAQVLQFIETLLARLPEITPLRR